jgi:hypothetical protein
MNAAMSGHGDDAADQPPAQPASAQARTPSATDLVTNGALGLLQGMFRK